MAGGMVDRDKRVNEKFDSMQTVSLVTKLTLLMNYDSVVVKTFPLYCEQYLPYSDVKSCYFVSV